VKKILITGANGFLGQHLVVYLSEKGYDVAALGRNECRIPATEKKFTYYNIELTNTQDVHHILKQIAPSVTIHTAAMSKPDECDMNRAACLENNVAITTCLAEAARNVNSRFIHLSTDFIFGEGGPHAENDVPAPLNFYGETKLMAEQVLQTIIPGVVIVRPVFIYGKVWEGLRPSFLHWVKNNLEQGKTIKVVSDQLRTPTYAGDICKGIELIIKKKSTGCFHLAGKDILSPYDMALTVANTLNMDSGFIEKVDSNSFPETVKRARRSGLLIERAERELDYKPVSFEKGVQLTFNVK
jgi:dTDP-4-dehydrorhamnose reductase